jgi:hypothetical protein
MTDLSIGAMQSSEFRIGGILSQSLSVLRQKFVPFMLVSAVAQLPGLFWGQSFAGMTRSGVGPESSGTIMVLGLLNLLLTLFSQATVIHSAFAFISGDSINLRVSLEVGGRRLGQVLLLSIYQGFAIVFASFLLLVPGIIVLTMWFVAMPVCVIERLRPIQSLTRSAQLTKGHRWKLFGLIIAFVICAIILVVVFDGVVGGVAAVLALGWMKPALAASHFVGNTVFGAFSAVLGAMIYYNLRVARDGVDSDKIAAVFE